jgi:hypothetical protein
MLAQFAHNLEKPSSGSKGGKKHLPKHLREFRRTGTGVARILWGHLRVNGHPEGARAEGAIAGVKRLSNQVDP